jgi:uncharacterized protein DUF6166
MSLSKEEERFYCGRAFGKVNIRGGGSIRSLEPHPEISEQERVPFTWGRDPSGASQLALALLRDALSDEAEAKQFHQDFNHRVLAILPERWTISRTRIIAHINMMKYQSKTMRGTTSR